MENTQYPEQHHVELAKEMMVDLLVEFQVLSRAYKNIEYQAKLVANYLDGLNPNQLRWDF